MTFEEFIPRLHGWVAFVANVFVGVAAFQFYQRKRLRSVLLVAVSSGIGAALEAVAWTAETSSESFWCVIDLLSVCDMAFWAVAMCLMFRDLSGKSSLIER